MAKPSGRRDADLDVVRGIAILLAMGWHLNGLSTQSEIARALLAPGHTFGWAGVDLFFVLSGYLIGRIVLLERLATGSFDASRFLVRRALRLWPVLYAFLAMQLLFGDKPWRTFLFQNVFHLQNYLGTSLNHLWSLAVEEQFYVAFATLFLLLLRSGFSPERLLRVLYATLGASFALRCAAVLDGVDPFAIQWQTHYRMDAIACGVLLAALSVHRPAVFAKLCGAKSACLAAVVACVAFLCFVPQTSAVDATVGYTVAYGGGAALILLVSGCNLVERLPAVFSPIAALSPYAYTLYIFHISAAKAVDIAAAKVHLQLSPGTSICLHYGAAFAAAFAVRMAIERPSMALRARLSPSPLAVDESRVPASPGAERLPPLAEGSLSPLV
ncbi:MAG: acyltransferase family protein [Janthinobacterium lividum]